MQVQVSSDAATTATSGALVVPVFAGAAARRAGSEEHPSQPKSVKISEELHWRIRGDETKPHRLDRLAPRHDEVQDSVMA